MGIQMLVIFLCQVRAQWMWKFTSSYTTAVLYSGLSNIYRTQISFSVNSPFMYFVYFFYWDFQKMFLFRNNCRFIEVEEIITSTTLCTLYPLSPNGNVLYNYSYISHLTLVWFTGLIRFHWFYMHSVCVSLVLYHFI